MSERITTAEELDALPVGSVMRTRAGQLCETGVIGPTDPQRVVWCDGWSDHAAAIEYFAPLTVLHRPDAPVTAGATVTRGVALIAAERQRQIAVEGYTAEHDAGHDPDDLARAAVCYATRPGRRFEHDGLPPFQLGWPWERRSWKPTPNDRVRELVKAGALIAAAIDALTVVDGPTEGGRDA